MKLASLLDGVQVTKLHHALYGRKIPTQDLDISAIQYDSRAIRAGDCFVALRGTHADGHRFVPDAIAQGASVVVLEDDNLYPDPYFLHAGVLKIVVGNTRKALALMSSNFYGRPASDLTMIGVTGTNGKTTTTFLLSAILNAAGFVPGLIGTIEYHIGGRTIPATHTTPESLELQGLLGEMRGAGVNAVAMEVSSHALDQSRTYGIGFQAAVFTNLTQDHLDYHGTMERYFDAKKLLFDALKPGGRAVINADDEWGARLMSGVHHPVVSYGLDPRASIHALESTLSIQGTQVTVGFEAGCIVVRSPLVGRFNVFNILAAFATGTALDITPDILVKGIESVSAVPGRFERIPSPNGWTAIVDYAHTPDALEKCLSTIREVLTGSPGSRVITVFGAGGDRDRTKRPLMGKIAAQLSDIVVITSDNPRTEDPLAIIGDIVRGVPPPVLLRQEPDRKKAIGLAVEQARPGDVILIAGKGHEGYQVIGTERLPFSDRAVLEELI